jgi:hypothetical protein
MLLLGVNKLIANIDGGQFIFPYPARQDLFFACIRISVSKYQTFLAFTSGIGSGQFSAPVGTAFRVPGQTTLCLRF